jgi:Ras-related protein Rab-1A
MNVIRCKIALVGDTHVGKTSIVNQLVKNDFNTTYQTTLGIDYNQYDVKIKDTNYVVQFHILDFTGFSIFREMLNNQIKDVNFILYVYDSTNLESFQNIKLWKKSINDLGTKKNVVEYLIGNKTEIPEKIVTDKISVDSFANNFKLKSWNVSARMKTNLNELFEEMGKIYYDHYINFINKIKNLN